MSTKVTAPINYKDFAPNLKEILQDCNINFLIGSGLSNPFFGTLGKIEEWLTELDEYDLDEKLYGFIKASIYSSYFLIAMKDNIHISNFRCRTNQYFDEPKSLKEKATNTYLAYRDFLRMLNHILYRRNGSITNKQINLFTTNIDIFLDKTIDDLELHYNDGFNGIFKRRFNLSNFRKSIYQKSSHYDNVSEIPVFNLLKIHGSITWELIDTNIYLKGLDLVKEIKDIVKSSDLLDIKALDDKKWEKEGKNITIEEIITESEKKDFVEIDVDSFVDLYEELQIINPTKEKFKDTTFNKTYYEMMRYYANQLEKENSVLFIHGFSMADEHIREITFRSIKSNPTLKVFLCSYTQDAKLILDNLEKDKIDLNDYHNVQLIVPQDRFDLKAFNEIILKPICEELKAKL